MDIKNIFGKVQEFRNSRFEDDDDIYCFGYNDIKLLQGKQLPFISHSYN